MQPYQLVCGELGATGEWRRPPFLKNADICLKHNKKLIEKVGEKQAQRLKQLGCILQIQFKDELSVVLMS